MIKYDRNNKSDFRKYRDKLFTIYMLKNIFHNASTLDMSIVDFVGNPVPVNVKN